jgi:hypothetical protein
LVSEKKQIPIRKWTAPCEMGQLRKKVTAKKKASDFIFLWNFGENFPQKIAKLVEFALEK